MNIKKTSYYKDIPINKTVAILETSLKGLSEEEAKKRISLFGYNEVKKQLKNPVTEFLSHYWGPMPWLLELTMILSGFLGHYTELIIIFVLLTINAVIGFINNRKSQNAIKFLEQKLSIKTKILRDQKWIMKDIKEIVPGDVISIGLGDIVPADTKILSNSFITVDQSALTGESLPVDVNISGIIYSGSIVKYGEAQGVVLNTGLNTYFGKTVELVKTAKPKSHQEQILFSVIRYMLFISLGALLLIAIYALILHIKLLDILTIALIFLLGSVPVALPAVFAVVLSAGALDLAKKGVIVSKLNAIEDAASMDILCLDKTGTITENKLSVIDAVSFADYKKEEVILFAKLASEESSKDLIDSAVMEHSKSIALDSSGYKRILFTPFDPSTKKTEAIFEYKKEQFRVVKGAPQIIISLCKFENEKTKPEINNILIKLSEKGYRIIAVAKSEDKDLNKLHLAGFIAFADPIRPDSKSIIEEIKSLGIKVKILTGDNIEIAKEIVRQISVGSNIIRMVDLENLSESEQVKIIETCDGFAEIYPEDKYKILKILQSKGHIVGMTGDGVNDSPALKQAEVGIAVSNATDIAKISASMVLTQPGLGEIDDAIKTSRQIYQRMLSWVLNKITKVIIFDAILVFGFLLLHNNIISTLGMVLLIFANDFLTMSISTDNVKYTGNPNKWNVKNLTLASLPVSLVLIIGAIIAVIVGYKYFNLDLTKLQGFVALLLIFTSIFKIFIVRERRHFWSSKPGTLLIIISILAIISFLLIGVFGFIIPKLSIYYILFLFGIAFIFTLVSDFPKYYTFKKLNI
ncbi:MAG: plasma-membrane proton-efflux P-type ATPase [Cyanobacteria bacterium]|nr:plasma-membrane proton-efflux P-type ATPase [Cyanobacteriota bacterium]